MIYDIKHLGQVFTEPSEVETMISLMKNKGRVLEPSCGSGNISNRLDECVCIEYDKNIKNPSAIYMDFFYYPISEKFDTIIGNPPYVRFQDIIPETKAKLDMSLFDKRTNLYMFFIYKCVLHLSDNGELIFLTPRSFLQATCCIKLNKFIYDTGSMNIIIDYGDSVIFKNANPNVIIWRYQKGLFDRKSVYNSKERVFSFNKGHLCFTENANVIRFGDLFYVKVGGVSGKDDIYTHDSGNIDFVCSYTNKTGETKKMIYNKVTDHLIQHKDILLQRKIKEFDENNWFEWGRKCYESSDHRIYVNSKTREDKPFFTHESNYYDGSVLGIFPKFDCDSKDIQNICDMLNNVDWDVIGFKCGGRFIFSQKALSNAILPNTFESFLRRPTIKNMNNKTLV